MRRRQGVTTLVFGALIGLQCAVVTPALAQAPLDLWPPATIAKIEDRSTLNLQVIPQGNYWEVFFDSEIGEAKWADSAPPYAVHTGDTIRIHGYLAMPSSGGPYPAIVVGHGHGGSGDPNLARAVAAFGYVALSIDGPRAGRCAVDLRTVRPGSRTIVCGLTTLLVIWEISRSIARSTSSLMG